jgi:hypothetical protein
VRRPVNVTAAGVAQQKPFRMYYIDDSRSVASGLASFTWLQMHPDVWQAARRTWMAFRQDLAARHGIAVSARLHATRLARGRVGHLSPQGRRAQRPGLEVIRQALHVIAGIDGLAIGTVYRQAGPARHPDAKRDLYQCLVLALDADLRRNGLHGMVFMDGNGSDPSYAKAHRALPPDRCLIEEPVFRHANADQWVQMADLVAWTAFQNLNRSNNLDGVGTWYAQILTAIDIHGGPIQL